MRTSASEVAYEDRMRRRMIDGIRRMGCWRTYVLATVTPANARRARPGAGSRAPVGRPELQMSARIAVAPSAHPLQGLG